MPGLNSQMKKLIPKPLLWIREGAKLQVKKVPLFSREGFRVSY
jgi:hypothetical protein